MLKSDGREKITTEEILTNLFKLGFDKIDPVFYTYVLESLKSINFEISKDDTLSDEFKKHITMDGFIYKLKKGINHDSLFEKNKNDKLMEYIPFIDFEEIVYKKLEAYGLDDFDIDNKRFSEKEISIIKECNERINSFNEFEKNYEEIEKLKTDEGISYIKWLINFTSKQKDNKFYDEYFLYHEDELSEEDSINIKKVSYLIRAVGNYTNIHEVSFDPKSVKLKYHDNYIEIGEIHGQGTLCFSKIIKDEKDKEGSIDFLEVVNSFGRIKLQDPDFSYESSNKKETYDAIIKKLINKYDPPKEM